jgi:hypothetical protein
VIVARVSSSRAVQTTKMMMHIYGNLAKYGDDLGRFSFRASIARSLVSLGVVRLRDLCYHLYSKCQTPLGREVAGGTICEGGVLRANLNFVLRLNSATLVVGASEFRLGETCIGTKRSLGSSRVRPVTRVGFCIDADFTSFHATVKAERSGTRITNSTKERRRCRSISLFYYTA